MRASSFGIPVLLLAVVGAAALNRRFDSLGERAAPLTAIGSSDSSELEPSVYYRRCADARAAGVAPIYAGEPGYREELDADGDGIACEPYHP
jgi:hypothetical protein